VSPARTGEEPLERRAIISGIGQSDIGRRLGRSDLDLTVEAAQVAIADAGLTRDDIDGLSTYPGMGTGPGGFAGPTSPEVQDALGLSLNWHDGGGEGAGQMRAVMTAALAVAAGLARHVLVYRTVSEGSAQGTGGRQGIGSMIGGGGGGRGGVPSVAASGRGCFPLARRPRPIGWPWWPSAACTSSA
jgi:acetyl-CoA acetyltransferase